MMLSWTNGRHAYRQPRRTRKRIASSDFALAFLACRLFPVSLADGSYGGRYDERLEHLFACSR